MIDDGMRLTLDKIFGFTSVPEYTGSTDLLATAPADNIWEFLVKI
jgi:hypothetical protein